MLVLKYPYMPSLKNICIYVNFECVYYTLNKSIIHSSSQLFM